MSVVKETWARLRALFRKDALDREFDDEAAAHIAMATEDYVQRGMPVAEAQRLARVKFGSVAASKDAHRDSRGLPLLEGLFFDLRLACRGLRRHRAFTLSRGILLIFAIATATLATTLGVANPILLRPLPFPDPDRLQRVIATDAAGDPMWLSQATLRDLDERVRQQRLAGYTAADFTLTDDLGPDPILGAIVTDRFFDVLRVRPERGRTFSATEFNEAGERVAILSHSFWQRRYGGDPEMIGRRVSLTSGDAGAREYLVVGIMPVDFWLFYRRDGLDVLVPFQRDAAATDRTRRTIENLFSRLESRTTRQAAASELSAAGHDLAASYGETEPAAVRMEDVQAAHFRQFRPTVILIVASAVLMVALAAASITSMVVAMIVSRQSELSLRQALGAPRWRLVRQVLTETAMMGIIGGITGLALGQAGTTLIRAAVPAPVLSRVPGGADAMALDWRVLLLVATAIALMTVVAACAALARGGVPIPQVLHDVSRGATDARPRTRSRFALVGVQLALAVALVTAATVVSSSLLQLRSIDLGIQLEGLTSVWLNVDPQRYPTRQARAAYYERVLSRVRALPGVETAGGVLLPSTMTWFTARVRRDIDRGAEETALPEVLLRAASPEYFQTVGIQPVAGRLFHSGDRDGTLPVTVISKSLGDLLWPGGDALGRQIRQTDATPDDPWLTVVGVVADVRPSPFAQPSRILYRPLAQSGPPWLYVMVRSQTDPATLATQLRQAVWNEDPTQAVDGPFSIPLWVSNMTAELLFAAYLGLIFAAVAVIVACASVYGLIAHLAQRAAREMGIRKALGAQAKDVIGLFMRRTAAVAGPAVMVGIALGVALMQLLKSEVEGVGAFATWFVLFPVALFCVFVALATYAPARVAASVDPATALRVD